MFVNLIQDAGFAVVGVQLLWCGVHGIVDLADRVDDEMLMPYDKDV